MSNASNAFEWIVAAHPIGWDFRIVSEALAQPTRHRYEPHNNKKEKKNISFLYHGLRIIQFSCLFVRRIFSVRRGGLILSLVIRSVMPSHVCIAITVRLYIFFVHVFFNIALVIHNNSQLKIRRKGSTYMRRGTWTRNRRGPLC